MPELPSRRHLAAIWDDFGRLSAIEGSIFIDLITNVFDGTDFELVGGTRPAAFTIKNTPGYDALPWGRT